MKLDRKILWYFPILKRKLKNREINNFLITGMPRSGTMFVARALNTSSIYASHDLFTEQSHRIQNSGDVKALRWINFWLNTNKYGDVSGCHRFYIDEVSARRKIILIRNPRDVLLSHMNMDKYNALSMIERVKNGSFMEEFYSLKKHIDAGIRFYRFEDYTNNKNVLKKLAMDAGVKDINIRLIDIKKKINTRSMICDIDFMPTDLLREFDIRMEGFNRTFGYKP